MRSMYFALHGLHCPRLNKRVAELILSRLAAKNYHGQSGREGKLGLKVIASYWVTYWI
jgi:hypothetical protein